ncbi:MAG: type II secretion system F family protein [Armatimonadota bacterium]|nr:type II secretion system F family protein [Armatimonadota bacterium]
MPRYSYTALTSGGESVADSADAASLPALAARLASEGRTIRSVREAQVDLPRIRGIPYFEIIGIYRQIASAIAAGLPLVEALQMLSSESRNARLKSLLYFLKSQISRGAPLSEAMGAFPNVFPSVHVAVVKAGEHGGRLGTALDDLADQAEAMSNMNRRFASALVYPTVIAIAALGLLNFGLLSIVPKIRALFVDLGVDSFGSVTKFIFFVAQLTAPATILLLIGSIILLLAILGQRSAASGRLWLDSWKLRIPVVGQIVEKAALARFTGMLGLLLDAGIDLPRAVNLASEGAGNRVVERLLKNVSAEVEMGLRLSDAIDKTETMPATLAWRLGVGEETGALPEALSGMSRLYAGQVDSLVTSLAGLLEPLLIIVIGSAVAMLVLGMFLPLAAVINTLTSATGY